jgi:hypothetical protein
VLSDVARYSYAQIIVAGSSVLSRAGAETANIPSGLKGRRPIFET